MESQEVPNVEHLQTRNGVDFSKIQIDKVISARKAGKWIDFETFSPYLSDYNLKTGEIWKDNLTPADTIGLSLSRTFREIFPKATMSSLYDDYNTSMPDSTNPRGMPIPSGRQLVATDQAKDVFKSNIVRLFKEAGAIDEDALEGKDYFMVSESSKQDDAVKLVNRLREHGLIEERKGGITFVNPNAENPLFRRINLRTKDGRWLCEALDAAAFLKPENLEITHIVVLPNQFKNQQDKVWEILRVLGIHPENYHNIFYDEHVGSQVVKDTIQEAFSKAETIQNSTNLVGNASVNWDDFDPYLYVTENYAAILPPDREILTNLVRFYKDNPPKGRFLEVGCGPNLYPVLAALPYADQVDIVEYGAKNIAYLRQQLDSPEGIWSQWIDLLKTLDPIYQVDLVQQLKDKVQVQQGNIFDLPQGKYDAVSMHFVSESLTNNWNEFDQANRKFLHALRPGGVFVSSFMENSQGYSSPGRPFPAVAVTAEDVTKSLKPLAEDLNVQEVAAGRGVVRAGHTGMLTATGHALRKQPA